MLLSDGIDAFLADRRSKGFARGTIRNDSTALRALLADVGNIEMKRLKPQHLDTFWAKHSGWSPGTQNRVRTHLGVFIKWAQARGYMRRDQDPLEGTRPQRVPARHRVIIPQEEFEPLLHSIDSPRSRAAVAIGLYLFTRISETQGLRWQDVHFGKGEVEVYREKTREVDTLPMCEELARELHRWKLAYGAMMGEEVQPGWFVIPGCTKPLRYGTKGTKGFSTAGEVELVPTKRANLGGTITDVLQAAGYYQPHEGGHTLRRSGAIALYNHLAKMGHDRSIRLVQAMLGHSSIQTTEVYLRLSLDRKVRNDLLAGKPMFPDSEQGQVLEWRGAVDGSEDRDQVRV